MLNLIRSISGNYRVPVVYLKDVERMVIGDVQIGPARKGDQGKMPFRILKQAVSMGVASVQEEYTVDERDLVQRIFLEQRDERSLNELPKDFYVRVKSTIVAKEGSNEREAKVLTQRLRELVGIRLKKIALIVTSSPEVAQTDDFTRRLTLEEEALVLLLSDELKDWMSGVLMF